MASIQTGCRYDDIIGLPRHISGRHAHMSVGDRAAQFAPFAALTGYDAVIQETARLTDACAELDESQKAVLNEKLQQILKKIEVQPFVTFTCFRPDERKAGGAYVHIAGRVRRIDACAGVVLLEDGTAIPVDSIYEIEAQTRQEFV